MNSLLIASNIVKRVFKSSKTLGAMIILPLVLIFFIIAAMGGMPASKTKVALADLDGEAVAAKVAGYIQGLDYEIVAADAGELPRMVESRKAGFGIVIPPGFSAGLQGGQTKTLEYYFSGGDAASAGFIRQLDQYLYGLGGAYAAAGVISGLKGADTEKTASEILAGFAGPQPGAGERQNEAEAAGADADSGAARAVENPAAGFAITFMMILIFTTIGTILEDKKKLTLARMFVSPVKEWEIILGNMLGSLALGLIQLVPLVLALMVSFREVSFYKFAGLFVILFCFLISIIGIGIGISGIIKRNFNPATLIAAVIMPASIVGGCFIPESMLPDFINKVGRLVPQKWVMDAMGRILGGASLGSVTLHLAIILLFGLAFATFGLKTLRPLAD